MTPGLVLVDYTSRPRSLNRSDLVIRKRQFTLINSNLTPQQSMVEDLLAIRDVLDAAGIGYLLVRGEHDQPVLAVDRKRRAWF